MAWWDHTAPAWFAQAQWKGSTSKRNGVHYAGDTISLVWNKTGATGYSVYNYDGTVVSSGALDGSTSMFTPATPGGGWLLGWYRVILTGPSSDSWYGNVYGATNFVIVNSNASFIPMPAGNVTGNNDVSSDQIAKGVLGIGAERWSIDNAASPTTGTNTLAKALLRASTTADYWTASGYTDSARPRYCFLAFPNGGPSNVAGQPAVDYVDMPSTGGNYYLRCFPKTSSTNGSTIWVELTVGGVINVYSPSIGTLAETYGPYGTSTLAKAAINPASSLIRVYSNDPTASAAGKTKTNIGNAYFSGVSSCVSSLYPAGVTRFEGPSNEPGIDSSIAQASMLFTAAVHDGNASAVALVPCAVSLSSSYSAFLTECVSIGFTPDGISTHAYNSDTNGDLNLGRAKIGSWVTNLTNAGFDGLERWQTESTQAITCTYGVHHPHHARLPLFQTILWEQNGVPRERNVPWYTVSQGFWAYPAWWEHMDGSLQPQAAMGRTLAEETFGQTFSSQFTFPGFADNIFLGSVYASGSQKTAVVLSMSPLPGATVTFSTGAAGPLTVVDGFGNQTTATVSAGKFTVNVAATPTYIRLAAADTISVSSVNDWGAGALTDVATSASCTIGGKAQTIPVSGTFISDWTNATGVFKSANRPPEEILLYWASPVTVKRVLVWCGSAWQSNSAFSKFTVDTSSNGGASWANQASVDVSTGCVSTVRAADSQNTACQLETYWPEQWVFDVKLPSPTACNRLRLNVLKTSYGGEPDAAAVAAGGQGNPHEHLCAQRVAVLT